MAGYWRLYYQGAKSRLEEFFEIDLGWVLAVPGTQGDLDAAVRPAVFQNDAAWREHLLTLLWLMFRRDAFLPGADGRTFHQIALAEGREWEAKVRQTLAGVVFEEVFPDLLRALVRADAQAPNPVTAAYLATVREAALDAPLPPAVRALRRGSRSAAEARSKLRWTLAAAR